MKSIVAIELAPQQATFLKLCNDNFATISFMSQSGVFQILNGNATLNFDQKGHLKSIKRELYTYAVSLA